MTKAFETLPTPFTLGSFAMFRRYLFRNYRLLAALQQWLKPRVTLSGSLVLWALLFAAGLGMDTDVTVAYQAFSFLACLVLVSASFACFSRGRYEARRVLPKFGTVGTALPHRVFIKNLTHRKQRELVLLENLADTRPTLAQFIENPEPGEEKRNWFDRTYGYYRWQWLCKENIKAGMTDIPLPAIAPRGEVEVSGQLMPRKRGRLDLSGISIAWPDPFGLFRSIFNIPCPQSVLILPKRYPLPRLPLPGTMKYQQGGVALASSVGESEEFVSLREYRPGDPMRHIHWRSWAKSGKPIVKEFQDEFFVRHALILDTFGSLGESEVFEEAVSMAASFACAVQSQDSLLDLMFVGPQAFCFTSGRGLAHTEQMLEILASVGICRDKPFSSLRYLVMEHIGAVSGCICVFIAWDEERQDLVRQLKVLGIPVTVFLVTPAGENAKSLPGPLADEPGNFRPLEVGKIGEGLARL